MTRELYTVDEKIRLSGYKRLCGVDEVGRGPLAGPVVAAAVILDPELLPEGLDDSKKLGKKARAELEKEIMQKAVAVGIGFAEPFEIDKHNILRASLIAMERAVTDMGQPPDFIFVDGIYQVESVIPQRTLVGGDGRSASIAAASIVAKERRDQLMSEYAKEFPGYSFESNMGYPTSAHLRALKELGPTKIHRKTFKGVKELLPPEEEVGQMRLL